MTLHAAIAWSAFCRAGHVGWLLAGMAYAASKYLFFFGSSSADAVSAAAVPAPATGRPGVVRRLVHWIGHADVRLHVWIILAAVGRLEWALLAYAAYFAARYAGGAIRKAVGHAP